MTTPSGPGRMGRAALVVASGILLSRLLGFLRNVVLLALLGRSAAADVYNAAFVIPDILNYLMAGGYLSITFIPILSRHLAAGDREEGWRSFVAVFKPLALVMVGLTAVALAAAGPIVDLLYPRFSPELAAQVTSLTRIVLPAQVFFVLGSLFMAVQYAHERFLVPTLAPIVYNAGIITGGLVSWWLGDASPAGFVWGALAGAAVGNFGLQWAGAIRLGLRWPGRVSVRHPALREYLLLALPLMIGQSIAVLDEQFTRIFGQLGDTGAITSLVAARQINMVPVGIIAQAAGVAAYPFLARLFAEGRLDELGRSVATAVRYVLYVSAAAAAALAAGALPAVRLAFQRGAFDAAATMATAGPLALYALAIPAWGAQQVYARAFYAQRRMWAPVLTGTIATIAALPLFFVLGDRLGPAGVALASTLSLSGYALALAVMWYRRTGTDHLAVVVASGWRAALGGGLAGGVAWLAARSLQEPGVVPAAGPAAVQLVAASVAAGLAYLAVTRLLGSSELPELLARRRAG